MTKEVLDIIESLEEAGKEIERLIKNNQIKDIQNLLSDMQGLAIALGNYIEKREGNGTETVALLEEYCELVWQCSTAEKARDALFLYAKIEQSMENIKRTIQKEILDKKEVVFLPYKASMWDSLESVWQAAKNSQNCDVRVIPIPYYDKKTDGSFGEMHYEDEYPDYVSITHYEHYNFAERRPDIIFIHNPYDGHNHVTSVHPFFYSKNLKQYTKKLVYIPYFILDEIEPDRQASVDNMSHFCLQSGVLNADNIIVQSEKMKQIYVNVLTKETGENTRSYWENKILGIGSPKVDKVLTTERESIDIPQDWLKVIKKPDGTWKKIIFYNISVNSFLRYPEEIFRKLENAFEVFEKNQSEIALLWRPHPLMKETLERMKPQFAQRYKDIVERYKEKEWLIYDDTADLNRAIALSNAYYGDPSSILHLYRKTGKNVMMQQITQMNYKVAELKIGAGVVYKNKLFFSEYRINGLFSLDLNSGEVMFHKLFKKEEGNFSLFSEAYLYKHEAWFIPERGRHIVKVDLNTFNMEYFDMPFKVAISSEKNEVNTSFVISGICKEKYLYFFHAFYGIVVLIDMERKNIISYFSILEPQNENDSYGCLVEEDLWLFFYENEKVLKVNLFTGETRSFLWNYGKNIYTGVEYDKGIFWFSSNNVNCILKLDSELKYIEKVCLPEAVKERTGTSIVKYEDKFWLLPLKGEKIVSLEPKERKVEIWGEEEGVDITSKYGFRKITSQKKLVISGWGYVVIWDSEKEAFVNFRLNIQREALMKAYFFDKLEENDEGLSFFVNQKGFFTEEYITLETFVKNAGANVKKREKYNNIGGEIWKSVSIDVIEEK